jgi:hypothetical protein
MTGRIVALPESAEEQLPTNPIGVVRPAGESATEKIAGNNLPFTGLDLLFVVLGGLLLIAAGTALKLGERARSRRASQLPSA